MATPNEIREKLKGPQTAARIMTMLQLQKTPGAAALYAELVRVCEYLMALPKGPKGDAGRTPVKGKDYYTPAEQEQFAQSIFKMIRTPADGKTPVPGTDYPTMQMVRDWIQTVPVPQAADGYTPIKGVDFFTEADIQHLTEQITSSLEDMVAAAVGVHAKNMPQTIRELPAISLFGGRGSGGGGRIIFRSGLQEFNNVQTIDFISGFTITRRDGYIGLVAAGASSGGHTIEKDGTPFTQRTNLNFTGTGVTVTDDAANDATVVNISGSSGGAPVFYDNEIPTGAINGSNTAFTLVHSPSPTASLQLFLNGQELTQGVDYSLSAAAITFTTAPDAALAGTPFRAFYRTDDGTLSFADNETPSGSINGSNTAFTLANAPTGGSLRLYLNGVELTSGVDYNISGVNITFVTAPDEALSGLPFKAFYRY